MKADFEKGTKICSKCKRELPIEQFGIDKHTLDGLNCRCKDCSRKSSQEFYQTERGKLIHRNSQKRYSNTEKGKITNKKYYSKYRQTEKGKEKIREDVKRFRQTEKGKILYKKSRERWRKLHLTEYRREKYQNNIDFKIRTLLRGRLQYALKNNQKSAHTLELLGCSLDELKVHLEQQFEPGMTWENYGTEWHIDHIVPCSYFDLTKEENQRICFNYRNLQPLWARDNYKKSDEVPDNVEELVEFLKREINGSVTD